MSKKIDEVLIDLKGNILSHMLQARKVNFCTDIWSKKGMTASFIGVTAHFFVLCQSQASQCHFSSETHAKPSYRRESIKDCFANLQRLEHS